MRNAVHRVVSPLRAAGAIATLRGCSQPSAFMPRHLHVPARLAAVFALGLLAAATARADALGDLRAALAHLPGQSPMLATADVQVQRHQGEGHDATEFKGAASVNVDAGPRGVQVLYGRELLVRLEADARAQSRDRNAKTPTQTALSELDVAALQHMVSAGPALSTAIDEATYAGEEASDWHGRPARKLSFTVPIEHLSDDARKYVKHFANRLEVWTAPDGTPLGSARHVTLDGRAFVVVHFEMHTDEEHSYAVAGDRLVVVREETRNRSHGAGESQDATTVRHLKVAQ